MSIGEKIAAARKAKGWSQEKLGEEIGVSVQAVSKWENNLSRPDTDRLVKLCDLLEISLYDLLSDHPGYGLELVVHKSNG